MNKKILITGAGGFIGSNLAELMVRSGYQVRGMVRYNSASSYGWLDSTPYDLKQEMELVMGDIRDLHFVKKAVRGCDGVINLASLIAIPYSYKSPESYVQTNIIGALNVLQAVRECAIDKLVQISTSEVYGSAQFVPITEEHPLVAQSPYAAAKIGADQMALAFYRSFETPVTIVRPFNTYGPRQSSRAIIPTIITQIAQNLKVIELGALTPTRDFSYVEDTAQGMIAALEAAEVVGEVINLGSNFEISIANMVNCIAELMGKNIKVISKKERLRPQDSEVDRLCSDNSKAKRLLNWTPKFEGLSGFTQGIRCTIDWFCNPDNLARYKVGQYAI